MSLTIAETIRFEQFCKAQGYNRARRRRYMADMSKWMALFDRVQDGPVTEAVARAMIGPKKYDANPAFSDFLYSKGVLKDATTATVQ